MYSLNKFLIAATLLALVKCSPQVNGYKYFQPPRNFGVSGFGNNHVNGNGHISRNDAYNQFLNQGPANHAINGYTPNQGRFDFSAYGAEPLGQIIQKHVYIHVPPQEPPEIATQRPIFVPPAEKHYKIIFIKAPTPPTPTAPVIPPQPQNEEKTLVYVLVKKPEETPEVVIPTPVPTQPSKPEVYFIRYKTQKEGYGSQYKNYENSAIAANNGVVSSAIDSSRPEDLYNGDKKGYGFGYNYGLPQQKDSH